MMTMKKYSVLALAALMFSLTLTGCGLFSAGTATGFTSPVISAPPSYTAEIQSPENAGQGDVYTDWSKLTPYVPTNEVFTRISENRIEELTPSDGYGMLYPFIGEYLYAVDGGYRAGQKMGLVTADGMIVLDAVCSNIYAPYSYYGGVGFAGYYALSKIFPNPDSQSDWDRYITRVAIAAADGSWVTPFEFTGAQIYADGVMGSSYETNEVIIFDRKGNVIFDLSDFQADIDLSENGLYGMVQGMSGGRYFPAKRGDLNGYSYYDTMGNILKTETPDNAFYYASSFLGGYAVVATDDYHYGLIDETGKYILPCEYESVTTCYDTNWKFIGMCIVQTVSKETSQPIYQVLDVEGKTLYESDNYLYWSSWSNSFMTGNGINLDTDLKPITINGVSEGVITFEGGVYLKSIDGCWLLIDGRESYIAGAADISWLYGGYIGYQEEDGGFVVLSPTGSEIMRLSAPDNPDYGQILNVMKDSVTGNAYLYHPLRRDWENCEVLDFEGHVLVTGAVSVSPHNGLVRCAKDGLYGYKNLQNQWVFAIRISGQE